MINRLPPSYEYRVFLEEDGQKALIASFSSTSAPKIGKVINIRSFKEDDKYPDQVKVLAVEQHDEQNDAGKVSVFSLLVEPAEVG